MPLIVSHIHTLTSTTCLGILAFLLACTAVVLVNGQVYALVVATGGVFASYSVAYFFVFVAMVSCIWVLLSKEAT